MHIVENVIIYTEMPPSFAGNSQSFVLMVLFRSEVLQLQIIFIPGILLLV